MTKRSRPTKAFLAEIEKYARSIRALVGADLLERVSPIGVAQKLGILVQYPADFKAIPDSLRKRISDLDAGVWSGGAIELPDHQLLVILNPNQTEGRANVTLLEEVAHRYLKHAPSQISTGLSGLPERTYNEALEQEAYWTAGAILVPSLAVARAVYRGDSASSLAEAYGSSDELAEMRIQILGLWSRYSAQQEDETDEEEAV